MKQSPEDLKLIERLASSRFSGSGFMGDDRRSLEETLAADRHALERLGVSAATLVRRLRAADRLAREACGAPVVLCPGMEARHYEAMGRVPSPFHGDGMFPKGETRISWKDGRQLRVSALGIALIERHGFFQGRGSPYRIEPELAAELPDAGDDAGGAS